MTDKSNSTTSKSARIRIARLAAVLCLSFAALIPSPRPAKADLFGGDVAVLVQILANAIQQLLQLREIVATGDSTLGLMQDINNGIHVALGRLRTMGVNVDPGIYGKLRNVNSATRLVEDLFGRPVRSEEQEVQRNADRVVAEALSQNAKAFKYANDLDAVGKRIQTQSQMTSPKGSQRLTAQSLGVVVHVLGESLRAQATSLKLQAQSMAIQNRKDKQFAESVRKTSKDFRQSHQHLPTQFALPRL